jgi:hypothetical protein
VNVSSLARFSRQQILYVVIAAVVAALIWATGQRTNPATPLVYTLCIVNLVTISLKKLGFLYEKRPFPYNLLIFLPLLLVLTAPVYLITSAVVWMLAPPAGLTLSSLIAVGWKFSFVVTLAFGIPLFLYNRTKEHLERRNVELQQTVERGTARLEMQEAELQRAREISSLFCRETFLRFRASRSQEHGSLPAW